MANKPSKKGLDKETLDFLTNHTNFDQEAIQVEFIVQPTC